MINTQNPGNLIQLLASYRRVEFPQDGYRQQRLAALAGTIIVNCTVTIRFTDVSLRALEEDSEESFSLCSMRQAALNLRRESTRLLRRTTRPRRRGNGRIKPNHELVTLRSQYDIFMSSVKHTFFLLDRDLAGRIDGAL